MNLFHDIAQLVIGVVLIVAAFVFLYALYFGGHAVPAELKDSLYQVIGGVIGVVGTIVGFYFGTSLSSVRSNNALRAAAAAGSLSPTVPPAHTGVPT